MAEVLIVIMLILLILCGYMLVKNRHTFVVHCMIADAIMEYHLDCIEKDKPYTVDYSDMCSYEKTLYSIFDWSYVNILPRAKYEIIKPYIKED